MFVAFVLAFLAAGANASSSLLQRAANQDTSRKDKPLLQKPKWLLGIGVALVSFVLQAFALGHGSLAAIEPVLAFELVLVVMGSGVFFRQHIGKQEWWSIGLMTAGTAGLIIALDPQKNENPVIHPWQWAVAIALSAGVVAACSLASIWIKQKEYRAALLGIATGISLGFTSALLKGLLLVFKHGGLASALTAWQLYVAIVLGIFTFWLLQMTLRTGLLVASQPGITLADPFVAILWGGFIFAEKMNGGFAIIATAVATLVLIAGAILLARAPALTED